MLTPNIAGEIQVFLDDGIPGKWIIDACKVASANNARNWAYAKAVLQRWISQGNQNDIVNQKGTRKNGGSKSQIPPPDAEVQRLEQERTEKAIRARQRVEAARQQQLKLQEVENASR